MRELCDEALLTTVFANNPGAYLNALRSDAGSPGGGTAAARRVFSSALQAAAGGGLSTGKPGSLGEPGSPVALFTKLAAATPSQTQPLDNMLTLLLDYDRFYLAEHHLYGSSRLGIKKYWPTQYRYQWSKSKTVAQNDAALDTNELSHRVAWYYRPWQSLVGRTERTATGHANRTGFYTSRILGQKGYELTNHLGNVMAVISDKVTEKPAVWNASLPATAAKRAGLSAAYDYYPFACPQRSWRGMQMPGRVVEDATVQCIPVTRTRRVEQIVASEDQIGGYNPFGAGTPLFVASGNNTHISYPLASPNPGFMANIRSISNPAVLDANMTFTALPSGTTGLMVDVTVQEYNHPSVTGFNRNYIGVGTLTVELRNLASGGIGTFLTTTQLTGGGTARLTVPPNMVAPGNVIRLWMHYDAPAFPTWMYDWGYTPQAWIQYSAVVKHILKPVDQQYVALSCDTDGAYAATYRYGFNGMQKDDELKGKGNSLDFGARNFDVRTGRWTAVDPHAIRYPFNSPYTFAINSPLRIKDGDGRDIMVLSAPTGAQGFGHAAVLIGSESAGWYYFSKNGTYGSSGSNGPSNKNPRTYIYYQKLSDFAESVDNFDDRSGELEYRSAFRITTSKEQDRKAMIAADQQIQDDYKLFGASCIDVPSDALQAAGLNPGRESDAVGSDNGGDIGGISNVPNVRFQAIKRQNKGVDATQSITPSQDVQIKRLRNSPAEMEATQKVEQQQADDYFNEHNDNEIFGN